MTLKIKIEVSLKCLSIPISRNNVKYFKSRPLRNFLSDKLFELRFFYNWVVFENLPTYSIFRGYFQKLRNCPFITDIVILEQFSLSGYFRVSIKRIKAVYEGEAYGCGHVFHKKCIRKVSFHKF